MKKYLQTIAVLIFMASPLQAQKMSSEGAPVLSLSLDWVATADEDGTLDFFKGFQIPASTETGVYSNDESKIITTAKGDFSVRLFSASDGKQLWKMEGKAETEAADFTNDDQYVVTGGESKPQIKVWRTSDGKLVKTMKDHQSIEGMLFNPAGTLLACGNEFGEIRIYDTSNKDPRNWPKVPKYVLTHGNDQDKTGNESDGHSDVNQVFWSKDGAFLYTAGRNSLVKKWNTSLFKDADAALVQVFKGHTGSIKCVRLSPDESLVASGSGSAEDARVVVWKEETGETILNVDVPPIRVMETVVFDPQNKILMSGGSNRSKTRVDSESWVWRIDDILNGKEAPAQIIRWYDVEFFKFDRSGTHLLSSHADGSLRSWNVNIDLTATGSK